MNNYEIKLSRRISYVIVLDEIMLIDESNLKYYKFTDTSAEIMKLIINGFTYFESIVKNLVGKYNAQRNILEKDINSFLLFLIENKIVEKSE